MSSHLLLPFEPTPLDEIATAHSTVTSSFRAGKTYPLEFRKVQLRKLFYAISDNDQRIFAALKADLNKPRNETYMTECAWLLKDILSMLANLDKYAKDETIDTEFTFKLMKPRMRKEPMGTVLIIGPFNYPLQLVLIPLVAAIAAGCTAVIKPSEVSPHSAALVNRIVSRLDTTCYTVVNGAIPETTALLDLKWDKICYTGNQSVGRIVLEKAAKYLTPVTLELGGQNPVLVTSTSDAKLAGKRVAWGKHHNCGQVCVGPGYVLIHPSKEQDFVEGFAQALKTYLPNGAKNPTDMSRIVNDRHFKRIKTLLDKTSGKIVVGGDTDESERYIEPTLVKIESLDDALLSEEVFGPVLPMLVVESTQKMVEIVKEIDETPLGLYLFSNEDEERDMVLSRTRSGGISVNDVMMHGAVSGIPFGGVGTSGTGKYRGKETFKMFTHERPVISQLGSWAEPLLKLRYPPYTEGQMKAFLRSYGSLRPNFDRSGRPYRTGFLWRVLFLGGTSKKAALVRYIATFLAAWFARAYLGMGK